MTQQDGVVTLALLRDQWKLSDVIRADVETISPSQTVRQASEQMRRRGLAGLLVVEDGRPVGIFSMLDLLIAAEGGQLDAPVSVHMTPDPVVLSCQETVLDALHQFGKWHYHKFPVVDEAGKLLGVITLGDILYRMVSVLEAGEPEEPVEAEDNPQWPVEIEYALLGGDFARGGEASSRIKRALKQLGVDSRALRRVAIVCYELEMNVIIHAYRGVLRINATPREVEIICEDVGPGIADLDKALEEGFSTASEKVRAMGFGAGMGLPNVRKSSDSFEIGSTVGFGTRVSAVIRLNR